MRIRLYRAAKVADAMGMVRAELGPDALILATRRVAGGVEVSAALDSDAPDDLPVPPNALAHALDYHAVPLAVRARLLRGALEQSLAASFRFAPLPLHQGAPPLLLAGPPGAGKTLTAARLATRLVMAGITPLVISADGQRAGGAEQLAAFTRVLGLDLVVACHPSLLAGALAARRHSGPVLIDLPGSNPFDAAALDEVQSFAAAARGSIAAVLPAGTDADEAADSSAAYATAGATHLVATRLDHARRIGGVLAAAGAGLALAEAGIGPGAADGLVPMTHTLLATRLRRPNALPGHAA